ncbi:hypothetical protein EBR57_00240 [bacterium]|nr:hypothetical protein [bacterium]
MTKFDTILRVIRDVRLLVALRWAAIVMQGIALIGAWRWQLPVNMGVVVGSLVIQIGVNAVTAWGVSRTPHRSEDYVFIHLLFDFAALTVFVVNSGGLANPFSGLFLIQALLAALLVSRVKMWIMLALTGGGYSVLLLMNNTANDHHRWMALHLWGMVVNHVLTLLVIAWVVVRIVHNLRLRERQVSSHQGLVAAGAFSAQIAHKMGTPLNMIAIMTEDLSGPTVDQSKAAILSQVDRAKRYLSHLFDRLGRIESDQDSTATLRVILQELVLRITTQYPDLTIGVCLNNEAEMRGSGTELVGLLTEILVENAAEAGASKATISVDRLSDELVLIVANNGPPLPTDFHELMTLGVSTKRDAPHFGIGLFLARLVIDSLSGAVSVVGPPGVSVCVRFPAEMVDLSE